MQDVCCYNCWSDKNTFYATENGFNLVKCSACGLLFVTPRPEDNEIARAHKTGVHRGTEELSVTGIFRDDRVYDLLKVLEDLFEDSSTLEGKEWPDIGFGYGEFLLALQKFSARKIEAKGMEPNIHKQESAKKRGLSVSIFDLDLPTNKYDVISFLNVYSHLPNPPSFILSCKRLLRPGGELLLETGDTANSDSEDLYRPLFLPDHLSFASESIVVDILERSGFEIVDIRKYPYMKMNLILCAKEIAKVFWPNKKSQLKPIIRECLKT